jgi:diguanylate cyclase (GGDEF)-like protein/PAS domain S-box-containing protein
MNDRSFLAAIVDSSDDAIIGKDLEGRILSWNHGAERLYGYGAAEMVGTSITRLVPEECENDVPSILAKIRRDEQVANYETKRQRVDGEILDVSLTVSPVRGSGGEIVAAATIARDITTRKRLERQLTQLVYHDDLTGLANRRRFTEETERKIEHSERYGWRGAVLLLDLDNFKALNDTLGHNAGDNLLKRAALRMRDVVRDSDVLARLGGDEFGVLLPEADRDGVERLARRLVDAMASQEVTIDGKRVGTISVGICLLDEPLAPEEPLSRADIAMYAVKDGGGNGFAVYPGHGNSQGSDEAPTETHLAALTGTALDAVMRARTTHRPAPR